MNTRQEFLEAVQARLSGLSEGERQRLTACLADMIDDRLEMGMDEASAVRALGDVDHLVRDVAPSALSPVSAGDAADYQNAIAAIQLHVKNADAKLVAGTLPDGMTARIEASAANVFTWSLADGVLTVREADEAKRGLFRQAHRVTLTLCGCRPERLIADSYGGDIEIDGLQIAETTVLASSSGNIELKRFACGGRTEITARSGDIELKDIDIHGDCKLENMSGDVSLKRVTVGSLRLRTASGDASGRDIRANTAAVGTTSGDIEMSGLSAETSALCETVSGGIELKDIRTPELKLSTSSGDIDVALPENPEGFDIQAQSRSGDVSLPGQKALSDHACRVSAVSVSGDIQMTLL